MTRWQKRKGPYYMLIDLLIAVFLAGLTMRASTNRNSFILSAANKSLEAGPLIPQKKIAG